MHCPVHAWHELLTHYFLNLQSIERVYYLNDTAWLTDQTDQLVNWPVRPQITLTD